MTPEHRKRNGRVIALVLAMSVISSLSFLAYAFVERANAQNAQLAFEIKEQEFESQLRTCMAQAHAAMQEAQRQRDMAMEQMAIAAARK